MINYPDKITVTELLENDGLVMANEIVKRYNSHKTMLTEIERLQAEKSLSDRTKIAYLVFSIITSVSLIFMCL